jgi:hypothetical protein
VSEALETRAEIVKLARLLDVDPDALSYLSSVSPEDLARFRDQATEALYARGAAGLKRMAVAGADQRARVAEHARSLGVLDDLGPVGEAPEPSR